MKKILFFILTFLFIGCVYADSNNCKSFTYDVVIDNVHYSATAKYCENHNGSFELDDTSIVLTDESKKSYTIGYNSEYTGFQISYIGGDFCGSSTNKNDIYLCDEKREQTEFTAEQISDDEYMINFLPKFIKYNNHMYNKYGRVAFIYYIADESDISVEQSEIFERSFKSYVENTSITLEGEKIEYQFQSNCIFNFVRDIEFSNSNEMGAINNNLSNSGYLEIAMDIKNLLSEATKIGVCTEDDLNAIRSQRDVLFLEYGEKFDAGLSSPCYNILFGDGLGKGNLYSITREAFSYVRDKGGYRGEEKITMSYYFFESYYQKGYAFLTGSTMQVEIKDTARCSIFGEKTVEIFQYGFDVMKYAGVIIGTLLCIIDIFKAVVQKDGESKKQFSILIKRIGAIVLLILTPILVEIIFDFISTIGIDDPICGIR